MSYITNPILTQSETRYISDIQTLFKVKNAKNEWVPYILEPHQVLWHIDDVVIKGEAAKHKIVIKSRNTSFTVSSIISLLMSVPFYPDQVIPVVRLNITRANDLINDIKNIIRNMNVIQEQDGSYYPFNPEQVNMDAVGSIKFPNGVEIRAFPATNSAAETIRGLRITGCAGLIDEANFMKDFESIYIALRDASAGSIDGEREFQVLIGTTRKGRSTKFNLWYENIEKNQPDNIKIYNWPVLDPKKVNLTQSLLEQDLKPIVKWHDIRDLESKRKEDLNTFKEEYMAMLVSSTDELYPYETIVAAIDNMLKNSYPIDGEMYTMGVDPAAINDFFAVSIFEYNTKKQKFLHYVRDVQLKTMVSFLSNLIKKWKPFKVRVDGNGLGFQLAQELKAEFGAIIEVIRGNVTIKTPGKVTGNVPFKEYIHTNQLKMLNYNQISLIEDEMQYTHYTMWKGDYTCSSNSLYGHGDIVIANGLALLPLKWKHIGGTELSVSRQFEQKAVEAPIQQEVIAW